MRISVVMAVFNGEEYIWEAVASVLNQTYDNFELIVVNDGSTDQTKEILDEISDPRFTVIHLTKNAGAANALNVGIVKSTGDWIAIQDADDISLPSRLEEQAKYINDHPDAVVVGSLIECIQGNSPVSRGALLGEEKYKNNFLTRKEIERELFHACPLCHGSVTFSKIAFMQAGGYNSAYRIAYDLDLWLRLLQIGPLYKVNRVLYQYRMVPRSLSHQNWLKTCDEVMQITTEAIKRIRFHHFSRKPRFIVLGNSEACQHYKSLISETDTIEITYTSYNHIEQNLHRVYRAFRNARVDGVIVLDGPYAKKALYFFSRKGMRLTHNLFNLWNVINAEA